MTHFILLIHFGVLFSILRNFFLFVYSKRFIFRNFEKTQEKMIKG